MKIASVFFVVVTALTFTLSGSLQKQESEPVKEKQEDKPSKMKLENLLTKALSDEFVKGREVIVSYVEIPPNMTMDRHWHPGEEFQYYIDGKVTIDLGDGNKIVGTPGKVGHVPYNKASHGDYRGRRCTVSCLSDSRKG